MRQDNAMPRKILTVIIPSYNMEAYLPKCLGSLIIDDKELLQKLDVIVVNDGSKDRTSEIAHEFEAKYPCVFRVIDKENGHYGSCVNAALPIAKGVYTRLLDADDYVDSEGFENYLRDIDDEVRNGDEAADMIVCEYRKVDEKGQPLYQSARKLPQRRTFSLNEPAIRERPFSSAVVAFRTAIPLKMGYRQLEGCPYTDTQWLLEPSALVRKVRFSPNTVVCYLIGRAGQTMHPSIYANSMDKNLKVALALVEHYPKIKSMCHHDSISYYQHTLLVILKSCYKNKLLGYYGCRCNGDLSSLDKTVQSIPELFSALENLIVSTHLVRFRYVRLWRQWRSEYSPGFVFFRIYMFLAKCKCNLSGIIHRKLSSLWHLG